MTDYHFLNERKDLDGLDLNVRFSRFFGYLQCGLSCFAIFCNKVLIENDRKYYLSVTYVIFGIES